MLVITKKSSTMFSTSLCVVVLLLCQLQTISTRGIDYEGLPCYHLKKNRAGTCKLLTNCDSALEEVEGQVYPHFCGLSETVPLVCCPNPPVGYKSRTKCLEYSKWRKGKCNIQYDRSKNITDALGREFPHLVLFGYSYPDTIGRQYLCTGSLISERFVLTSAYCIEKGSSNPKVARLGELDLSTYEDDTETEEVKVEMTYVHHLYDQSYDSMNIGLVKLARDVQFNEYIYPTCLNLGHDFDKKIPLLVAGWAREKFYENGTQRLQRVMQEFIEYDNCSKEWVKDGAKDVACGRDSSCIGDWGGAVHTVNKEVQCMYSLVGISSSFDSCDETNKDSVFVSVPYHLEWIERIVWP